MSGPTEPVFWQPNSTDPMGVGPDGRKWCIGIMPIGPFGFQVGLCNLPLPSEINPNNNPYPDRWPDEWTMQQPFYHWTNDPGALYSVIINAGGPAKFIESIMDQTRNFLQDWYKFNPQPDPNNTNVITVEGWLSAWTLKEVVPGLVMPVPK